MERNNKSAMPVSAEKYFMIVMIFTIFFGVVSMFSNPTMHDQIMVLTWTSFIKAYAQCLRADCDLDL